MTLSHPFYHSGPIRRWYMNCWAFQMVGLTWAKCRIFDQNFRWALSSFSGICRLISLPLGSNTDDKYWFFLPKPTFGDIWRLGWFFEGLCSRLSETLCLPVTFVDQLYIWYEALCGRISRISKTWGKCEQARCPCWWIEQVGWERQVIGSWRNRARSCN